MNTTSAIQIIKTVGLSRSKIRGITINTDASYNADFNVGGYAFHIVCDLFKIQKSGMFKHAVQNSTEAEIKAIANAFATLLAQSELPQAKWIYINTDSMHGIQCILKKKTQEGTYALQLLKQLAKRMKCTDYKFRHVKAHSGVQDARSFANEWCDREAKIWMRMAVKNKVN